MISSVVKGRGGAVRRAGGYIDKNLYPLNSIEITKYFNYKPRFNSIFSINYLPRIKDGAYTINLDDKKSKRTYWLSLFIDRNTAVYFDFFVIKYVPQEVLNKIKVKSVTHKILKNKR